MKPAKPKNLFGTKQGNFAYARNKLKPEMKNTVNNIIYTGHLIPAGHERNEHNAEECK